MNREIIRPWNIRTEDRRCVTLEPGCRIRIIEVDPPNLEMRLAHFGWFSMESVLWHTEPLSSSTSTA